MHTVAKYDLLVLTRRSFVKLPEAGGLFGLRPSAFPVTFSRACWQSATAVSILLKSHNALILCTRENYTDITLRCSGVCSSFATLSSLAKMHHATQSRRHNASCLSTWPIKQGKCGENHCIFLHPHLNCSAVLLLCIVLYTRQIVYDINGLKLTCIHCRRNHLPPSRSLHQR